MLTSLVFDLVYLTTKVHKVKHKILGLKVEDMTEDWRDLVQETAVINERKHSKDQRTSK